MAVLAQVQGSSAKTNSISSVSASTAELAVGKLIREKQNRPRSGEDNDV